MSIRSFAAVFMSVSFWPDIEPVVSSIIDTSMLVPELPPTAIVDSACLTLPSCITGKLSMPRMFKNGVLTYAVPRASKLVAELVATKLTVSLTVILDFI